MLATQLNDLSRYSLNNIIKYSLTKYLIKKGVLDYTLFRETQRGCLALKLHLVIHVFISNENCVLQIQRGYG